MNGTTSLSIVSHSRKDNPTLDWKTLPELSTAKSKLLRKLQARKYRRREGLFVAEGVRLVEEAAACGAGIEWAVAAATDDPRCTALVEQLSGVTEVYLADDKELSALLDAANPQAVAAVCRLPEYGLETLDPPEQALIVICDTLRDPGNFGAVVRTAAAAGCSAVVAAGSGVDPWNPKAVRGSMGAVFRLPVIECDSPERLAGYLEANNFTTYLADMGGVNLYSLQNIPSRCAVVIGGEAGGAGAFSARLNPTALSIPMAPGAESLNAAVAAGIMIYQLSHTRGGAGHDDS